MNGKRVSRKRFTDADKWEDPWFCEQTTSIKLFWLYLCDRCDHGGVWAVNWKLAKFHLGDDLTPENLKAALSDRIQEIDQGRKWFIPKFISFQYPTGLSLTSPAHKRIRSTIQSHGINPDTLVYTLSNRVLDTPEDKEEDKDKDSSSNAEIGPTDAELEICRVHPSQESPSKPKPVPRTFLDFRQGRGLLFIGKDKADWEYSFRLYEWDAFVAMYDALKSGERVYYNDALRWLSDHYNLTETDYARAQAT